MSIPMFPDLYPNCKANVQSTVARAASGEGLGRREYYTD